jgi:hypothetical protein
MAKIDQHQIPVIDNGLEGTCPGSPQILSLLDEYRAARTTFYKFVDEAKENGEGKLRGNLDDNDKRAAEFAIKSLCEIEAQYFGLITNSNLHGYVPPIIFCKLKAIYEFRSTELTRSLSDGVEAIQALINHNIPPFRFIPKYSTIRLSESGKMSYFPIQDYIIYFGTGKLGLQAAEREKKNIPDMLPVGYGLVRAFAQRAIVDGALDQTVARHLYRVTREKFEDAAEGNACAERTLAHAHLLVERLKGISPRDRHYKDLDIELTPLKAFETVNTKPFWYLEYSPADRQRIAQCYSELGRHAEGFKFTPQQIRAFHRWAVLIDDAVTSPEEIIEERTRALKNTKKAFSEDELAAVSAIDVNKNQWGSQIAEIVLNRLTNLNLPTSDPDLGRVFIFPLGRVLSIIGVSNKLDRIPEIKAALDEGRLRLLERLSDSDLREIIAVAKSQESPKVILKFIGGETYKEAARERFKNA